MEIEIKVKADNFQYNHTIYNLENWVFIKEVVDKLFELNPEKKVPVAIAIDVKKLKPKKEKVEIPAKTSPTAKYPAAMESFVKREIDNLTNDELIDYINKKWDVGITKTKFAAYKSFKQIKRTKLKTLPPEEVDPDIDDPRFDYHEDD